MDALPIAIFWIFAVWGLFGPSRVLIFVFFCSMPFGSFAVIPPALTAGLTFTSTPIVALLIIARQIAHSRGINYAIGLAFAPRNLLLLFLFWIIAAFVTLIAPRLFAGHILVIPMRIEGSTYGEALYPTAQNISQLVYLTISVATTFAFARLLRSPASRQHVLSGLIAGGWFVVLTGLLDYLTQFIAISPLLEPFRTATYALMTDVEIFGGKRAVGLMPEASAYGGLVLTFISAIYFLRRAMLRGIMRDRVIPTLLILLVLMLWLSTSSAAYVGFAVFCFVAVAEWLWRATRLQRNAPGRQGLAIEFWIVVGLGMVLCVIILVRPAVLDPIVSVIDELVFKKTSTSSFEERSMWTAVSWQALLDSYGFGVGLGGTRASNGVVAILSSTGFVGGGLYFAFVLQTFLRRAPRGDHAGQAMSSAALWAFLPPFVTGVLAGTTPDFGVFNGFLFGLALALELEARRAGQSQARKNTRGEQRGFGQRHGLAAKPPNSPSGISGHSVWEG